MLPANRAIPLDFGGSTALVTGASRGIGEAIAKTLLDAGATVAITSTGTAPDWIKDRPAVTHFALDFERDESIENFLREIESVGPLDILVNNAGVHQPEPIDEISSQAWQRLFRVNVYGPTMLTKHIATQMKTARRGRIVNIASIAGTVCKRNAGVYSSSKLGLIGLTRASAVDLAPYGVLVNAVSPGTTRTDMVEQILTPDLQRTFLAGIPLGRFGEPQEIANVAVFLASEWNTYITGQNIIVDGGTTIV
jgi:3-oxoacyl-[acyl-carrier protein] reductase